MGLTGATQHGMAKDHPNIVKSHGVYYERPAVWMFFLSKFFLDTPK